MKKIHLLLIVLMASLFIGCTPEIKLDEPLVVNSIYAQNRGYHVYLYDMDENKFLLKTNKRFTVGDTLYLKRK